MATIKTTGIPKEKVLAALYNRSKVQGMGIFQAKPGIMDDAEAAEILKKTTYFDYLYGKVMKVDLSNDEEFEGWLFDRDNGDGAAQSAIDSISN